MKFTTVTLLAAIIAVAAAQSSSGDGIITISPIPGTTDSPATSTRPVTATPTSGVPTIPTSGSVSAPIGTKTTTGTVPSPTKPNGGNALSSTSAKVLLAIGGGAAVLAQFL
ncbi:hypothetical protein BGZ93_008883 [Podila epicladia]|nr:hypothetical protein BGZ92_010146 [Podila epicladia]KAG0091356.1 hypothetical protein BGZ93_008883 [Podila epicladia]